MSKLENMLQPGKKIRIFYNKGNVNNCICHIRAIVDSEYIVYRVWSKKYQGWCYYTEHRYNFEYKYEKGVITYA